MRRLTTNKMWHDRTVGTTAVAVVVALLTIGVSPAAGAADDDASWLTSSAAFTALGEYADPAGDSALPGADLVEVVVNYDSDDANLVVIFDTVADQDPSSDPAWDNTATRAMAGISLDADDDIERVLTLTGDDASASGLIGQLTDPNDDGFSCPVETIALAGVIAGRFPPTCVDQVSSIRLTAMMAYQPTAGAAVATDELGDGLTLPLPDEPEESPVCANATSQTSGTLTVRRLACGIGGTEPISQGVATSQFVFDIPETPVIDPYTADYAVIARDDNFADALTGSSLSFGQGPLLFTHSPVSAPAGHNPAELAPTTRAELIRTVPRGRTVYLMGGVNALDGGLEATLGAMGYEVVRFAGVGREQTARLVSREVDRLVADFASQTDFIDTNMVLIATRNNWPDAVVAGSIGAFWGMPILLVDVNPPVHPDTLAALDELRPDYLHVIGGTSVISDAVGGELVTHARANDYGTGRPGADLTSDPWQGFNNGCFGCRWGGDERVATGANVAQFNRDMVRRFGGMTELIPDNPQQYAVGVSLEGGPDSRNFSYVLSAATVSGRFGGAVFIPTADNTITPVVKAGLCTAADGPGFIEQVEEFVLVGDTDLLSDAYAAEVRGLVEGGCNSPPPTFATAPAALGATPL